MNNAPDVRMNDVPLACDELAKSVTVLEEVLMQFQKRLNRITRSEPTSTDTENRKGLNSSCELSGTIRDQTNRLRDMAERIQQHNDALEL